MDDYNTASLKNSFCQENETDEDIVTANEIITSLKRVGSRLVCVDFDVTFLSIHTGGVWDKSAQELHQHVRPLFLVLFPLVFSSGIDIAVVTFSPQVTLIRKVLHLCYPQDLAEMIVIRGDDNSWNISRSDCQRFSIAYEDTHVQRSHKLPYIVSAASFLSKIKSTAIRNIDTVLIDDDLNNIHQVHEHGIAGIWFEPNDTDIKTLCNSIRQLHVVDKTSSPPSKAVEKENDKDSSNTDKILKTPGQTKTTGKKKKFNFCTPSPVLKVASCKPRKPTKLRCSRKMEDIADLNIRPHGKIV